MSGYLVENPFTGVTQTRKRRGPIALAGPLKRPAKKLIMHAGSEESTPLPLVHIATHITSDRVHAHPEKKRQRGHD